MSENEKREISIFRKVIVGFDGSERGLDALSLGQALTASEGEVIVCCVHRFRSLSARIDPTEPSMDRDAAEESVGRAIGGLHRSVHVTTKLVAGASAVTALQSTATDEHAELIVLGSSHRGAAGRVLVGSVAEETLHGAPCPVAVAPVGWSRSPKDPRLAEIGVAYDDRARAGAALRVAGTLAAETGAHLQVIAIANTATPLVPGPAAGMAYLATIEDRLRMTEHNVAAAIAALPDGVTASSDVRKGLPAEEILRAAHGLDLLVLGSHGRGPLGRVLLGSVSDAVVRAAACPVLVVPPAAVAECVARHTSDKLAGA